ncbi:MAG: DUF2911 domain-containing protein [Cyclobacteriaceae bacterium]|jgi:hypothetical protein|nr:DUF2911 domain-containing protein [Flammeovirgaceae bacterium]
MRLIALFLLLLPGFAFAQEAASPRPSPIQIVTARYKETYLKITYSQPKKKGRQVFGKLVPYDQIWRTGANEATEITITKDILINQQPLKAGTYSLFTIPSKDKWTIIINSDVGMWGSYNYNSKKDVLRFEVPSTSTGAMVFESFTLTIDSKNDKATISLAWDTTQVSFPVQFNEPK